MFFPASGLCLPSPGKPNVRTVVTGAGPGPGPILPLYPVGPVGNSHFRAAVGNMRGSFLHARFEEPTAVGSCWIQYWGRNLSVAA